MALQITLFQNSGFSIGITTNHAAMDGKSSTMFMKSWAYICSNIEQSPVPSFPENQIPFFDRSVIKEPNEISGGAPNDRSLTIMDFGRGNQENLVRGRFELTPSIILNLKKSAESKLKKEAHISTFSVTRAHVLQCLVKAEQTEQNRAQLLFPVDCRSRLDPPIPPTYFGNCVDSTYFMWEKKSLLGEDGFVSVIEGITEALKKFENGEISVAKKLDSAMKMFMDPDIIMFQVAGSPRFEVYGEGQRKWR